jgi:hypothetical protein
VLVSATAAGDIARKAWVGGRENMRKQAKRAEKSPHGKGEGGKGRGRQEREGERDTWMGCSTALHYTNDCGNNKHGHDIFWCPMR